MAFANKIKVILNAALKHANIKLDTLTAERTEAKRVNRQKSIGQFDRPVFPLLEGMSSFDVSDLADAYSTYRSSLEKMMGGAPPANFNRNNDYFRTPDAEILYLMVRLLSPKRIIEVGSGNSTRIIRQAIVDAQLDVVHLAIDPEPRSDITGLAGCVRRQLLEEADVSTELSALDVNDILFIDSSHVVRVANDVSKLFCIVIPSLKPGVAVHVHDVFLPFDYPEPFCALYPHWGEQYLLQAMLASRPRQILWPGYYIQKIKPELQSDLPFMNTGCAQSFWFRS